MPPGFGEGSQTRGDIDAVADDVALLDDDVTLVDADPPLDPLVFRSFGIALGHLPLDRNRACDGLNEARKARRVCRRRSS